MTKRTPKTKTKAQTRWDVLYAEFLKKVGHTKESLEDLPVKQQTDLEAEFHAFIKLAA